jgi:hypothetical protein
MKEGPPEVIEAAASGRPPTKKNALLVKDKDGNIYYLRPEILEAAQVKDDVIRDVQSTGKLPELLDGAEVSRDYGDKVNARAKLPEVSTLKVSYPSVDRQLADTLKQDVAPEERPEEFESFRTFRTVMCPW